ncbi:hypothetical protein H8B09_11740 [Paenibacillus sp. PR3]|uniref:Tc toxin complex TcA C-terminal TcB-binding domain-containing protein n=1 Tax=Paenibacillus terricola TaxID=2763503 RepID=A0ABR8MVY5_9BACL|nr:hypothetical protein [Paenibacillus terricola]MBD3919426.1 hypothetical protein [Paenibacillus terricola]
MNSSGLKASSIADATLLSQSLESFQKCAIGDNTVIISVEDSLAIGAGSDIGSSFISTSHLSIFAEDVILSDAFKMPNGVLAAHSLTTSGAGRMDLSGAIGYTPETVNEDANSPGETGGTGSNGGNLLLYVEQVPTGSPAFRIAANGGDGGAGQPGTERTAGGQGGDGGHGGNVLIAVGSPYELLLGQLRETLSVSELSAKQAMVKEIIANMPAGSSLIAVRALMNQAVGAGDEQTYDQALENAALVLQSLSSGYSSALHAAVDISAGNYGVHGDGISNGGNGAYGQPGKLSNILFNEPNDLCSKLNPLGFFERLPVDALQTFFPVHPSQCRRLLEKIKLMYWSLDPVHQPQVVTDVLTLLIRLQARTALFANAEDDSPLIQYYAQHENAIGAIGAVDQLRAIYDETTRCIQQLKQGQDLFGYSSSVVPLGSFLFYKNVLDELINNFGELESSYTSYFQALEANTAQIADIKSTRDKQASLVATAQSQLTPLNTQSIKTARIIDGYQVELVPLKKAYDDALIDAENTFANKFNLNFDTVLQSLTSLAFAPESTLNIVAQAGQFLYDGTAKITDDQGNQIRKDYIVSQLKTVQADMDSLQEGYQSLDNGLLKPDDPGAGKLIADEQAIEQLLQDYYGSFPKEIDAVKTAMSNYVAKIQERNTQILTYNAIILLIYQNEQLIDSANARTNTLNEQMLDAMAPDLPDLVTMVSGMYYAARNQVMQVLDLTSRAFRFWALSDSNLTSIAYAGKPLPELNYDALLGAKTTILSRYQQAIENFGTNSSQFPAHSTQQGKMYEVSDEQVELFCQLGQLMLRISPDDPVFAGMANVRVQSVRVWISGLSFSGNDKSVNINVTHTGKEQIVSTARDVYAFSHEPVNKLFIYNTDSREIMEEANFGVEQSDGGATTNYAALGPFTTWHITIDPASNPDVDFSAVSRIQLEFHGTNYAFDA